MVAVSNSHNFIFLKTRKTAGTSIEMYLQPLCTAAGSPVVEKTRAMETEHGIIGSRLIDRDDWKPLDRKYWAHSKASELRDNLGEKRWGELYKLTCVRNPFDKVLSHYFWNQKRAGNDMPATVDAEIAEFRKFVHSDEWANDRSVVFLAGAYQPDFAIRFENMAQDLSTFLSNVGVTDALPAMPETKVTRTSRRAEFADYFDKDSADIIRDRFRWIFSRFDYPRTPKRTQTAMETNAIPAALETNNNVKVSS